MPDQFRDVLFWVFTGFFVVIGIASLLVLLGFGRGRVDAAFRKWALASFVAAVTSAVLGLFRLLFLTTTVTISVTLLHPQDVVSPPSLDKGTYEYDMSVKGRVSTQSGDLVPVLSEGGWQIQLPGEVADKGVRLKLHDKAGGWWEVDPFFPNHVSQRLKATLKQETTTGGSSPLPGVAVLMAAERGGESDAPQKGPPRFTNYARSIGVRYERPYYEWRVFVDEPAVVLSTIQQVDYVLHPTFPDPFRSSRDRAKNFELVASGWGQFTIMITVHYTNGAQAKASYDLDLKKPWPAPQASSQAPPPPSPQSSSLLELRLDKIVVSQGGSTGRTGWVFDIAVNGQRALSLPKADYSDSKTNRRNEYAIRRSLGRGLKIAPGEPIRIQVNGTRTFGIPKPDTATGAGTISAAGPLAVTVKNGASERKGSFVFHFTAAAAP